MEKIIPKKKLPFGDLIFDFFREGRFRVNKANGPVDRIKIWAGDCAVGGLDRMCGLRGWRFGRRGGGARSLMCIFFGGGYDRGRDVHGYSNRGSVSRAQRIPAAAATGKSGEPHNTLDKNRPDKSISMKFSNLLTRFPSLLTIALLAGAWGILPANLQAAEPEAAATKTCGRATVVRLAG